MEDGITQGRVGRHSPNSQTTPLFLEKSMLRTSIIGLGWSILGCGFFACTTTPVAPPPRPSEAKTSPANPCAEKESCHELGECTAADGTCIVGSDSDCADAIVCTKLGLCAKVGEECRATDDASCQKSDECMSLGRCVQRKGVCVALKDSDCQKSLRACEQEGRCSAGDGTCIAKTDEDCADSQGCLESGRCTAVGGECSQSPSP